jgi:hypothetical protein
MRAELHGPQALAQSECRILCNRGLGYRWGSRSSNGIVKPLAAGTPLPSSKALRWPNELAVLLLLEGVYLALGKPL